MGGYRECLLLRNMRRCYVWCYKKHQYNKYIKKLCYWKKG